MTGQTGSFLVNGQVVLSISMLGTRTIKRDWPLVEELLLASPGQWEVYSTLAGIKERLLSGAQQFWIAEGAKGPLLGMLSEVVEHETGLRELQIVWLGGHSLSGLDKYFHIVEVWAKSKKCDLVSTRCRPGIKSLLRYADFKARSYIISKTVMLEREQ